MDEFFNPPNCHPVVRQLAFSHSLSHFPYPHRGQLFFLSSDKRDKRDENSQTPLSIRKFLMIPHQMFLIPRIFFDIFVIFDTVECHLAETVVICNISPVFVF